MRALEVLDFGGLVVFHLSRGLPGSIFPIIDPFLSDALAIKHAMGKAQELAALDMDHAVKIAVGCDHRFNGKSMFAHE
jgi:hypothetical protein